MLPTALFLAQQLQAGEPLAIETSHSYIEIHVVDQYEKGIPDAEIVLASAHRPRRARAGGLPGRAGRAPWGPACSITDP